MTTIPIRLLALMPTAILLIGCSKPPDDRLVEVSERAAERQKAQNETIARQTEQTTKLSNDFIDAEGEARQDLLALQQQFVEADARARQELHQIHEVVVQRDANGQRDLDELRHETHAAVLAQLAAIDQQRDELERERREIARARKQAPVVAEAVEFGAGLIACVMPLLCMIYLLRSLRTSDDTDAATVELLVNQLAAGPSALLLPPDAAPALPVDQPHALDQLPATADQ